MIAKTSMNLRGALFALVFPACSLFGVDLPKPDIVVATDGTGNFETIQAAVESIPVTNRERAGKIAAGRALSFRR